jgi:hypothetical protein
MKTIATLIAGAALGAILCGLIHTASASGPDLARDQVQALRDIATELRDGFRECKR